MVRRQRPGLRGDQRQLAVPRRGRARTAATSTSSGDEEFVPASSSSSSSSSVSSFDSGDDASHLQRPPSKRGKRKRHEMNKDGNEKKNEKPLLMWKVLEEEYNRWIDDHVGDASDVPVDEYDGGMEETRPEVVDVLEPSSDVILPLLKFQKEWLAWAIKQENESPYRGGILADEMGMGKTIEAISLVLTARSIRNSALSQGASSSSSSSSLPTVKCTLVICPVVAVMQWVGEIHKYTKGGSVRVLVYHGPQRKSAVHDFSDYDFVITTFSIVEADYRKDIAPPKEMCKWCGNLFYPSRLKFHLKYFCGPFARKTDKQAKQATKKKKNRPVLDDEPGEAGGKDMQRSNANGATNVKKKKNDEPKTDKEPRTTSSILFGVKWERIILDEAHAIKCRKSSTARAVFFLGILI